MPDVNKINIVQKLAEDDLTIYPLSALKNEASSYGIAIFQPLENVIANDTEVKNECISSISQKYEKFFSIEGVKDKALLLSPEYSCPWDLLEKQLNEEITTVETNVYSAYPSDLAQSQESADNKGLTERQDNDRKGGWATFIILAILFILNPFAQFTQIISIFLFLLKISNL